VEIIISCFGGAVSENNIQPDSIHSSQSVPVIEIELMAFRAAT
jgi:hypothetical protein